MFVVLLRVRLRSLINTLVCAEGAERAKARRTITVGLLVAAAVGMLSYGLFAPLALGAEQDPVLLLVLDRLPALAFFVSFWLLLMSGITAGIQSFYLSPDLPLLLAAPISSKSLFGAKFVEGTLSSASMFLLIGAPMLAAYGIARGTMDVAYAAVVIAIVVAFSAMPTSLGMLFTFVLMRVLPAGRTRDVLAALGVAAFATFYFVLSAGASKMRQGAEAIHQGADLLVGALSRPVLSHGPWEWAQSAVSGDRIRTDALASVAVLTVAAACTVAICAMAARWLHVRGWSEGASAAELSLPRRLGGTKPGPGAVLGSGVARAAAGLGSTEVVRYHAGAATTDITGAQSAPSRRRSFALIPPGPFRGVLGKEFRTLGRDLRQLSMLFVLLAVVGVFLVNAADRRDDTAGSPFVFAETLLFVLAPISLRLALTAFVAESRAFWLMLSAPVDPIRILAGKFAFACSLAIALAMAVSAAFAHIAGLQPATAAAVCELVACAVFSFSGIGVGACAMSVDLKADSARFAMPTAGRLVVFAGQIVYALLAGIIVGAAWLVPRHSAIPPALVYGIACVTLLGMSAAFTIGPLLMGARRLRSLEW